jgi:hypothetical protein
MQTSWWSNLANSPWTFLAVLILGSAACSAGIGKAARLGLWLHPLTLAGYLLGATALALVLQGLFQLHVLPITGSLAFAAILGIMVVKAVLATFYPHRIS